MRRILLVDDEIKVLHALQRALRQHAPADGLSVETFTNPFDALARCCGCDFDLVISDQRMPEMSGIDFLNALKDVLPHTVRVMLTASTDFDTALGAINQAEVFRFVAKPWQTAELIEVVRLALAQRDRLLPAAPAPALSAQEREARRLEQEEPGITRVKWSADGSVIL